jgi:ElaB/YqjD/DUF883 family membrane-anchored ribosome-binding protein
LLSKAYELTRIIEDKIKAIQNDVRASFELLNAASEKSRTEVTQLFNEIRKIVNERETALKQKIAEQKQKEEAHLRGQEERITHHHQNILAFYSEYERTNNESDNKLLSASLARLDLIKRATANVQNLDFYIPFNEINRDIELNFLWKMLNPMGKNSNHHQVHQHAKSANTNSVGGNNARGGGNQNHQSNYYGNTGGVSGGPSLSNNGNDDADYNDLNYYCYVM